MVCRRLIAWTKRKLRKHGRSPQPRNTRQKRPKGTEDSHLEQKDTLLWQDNGHKTRHHSPEEMAHITPDLPLSPTKDSAKDRAPTQAADNLPAPQESVFPELPGPEDTSRRSTGPLSAILVDEVESIDIEPVSEIFQDATEYTHSPRDRKTPDVEPKAMSEESLSQPSTHTDTDESTTSSLTGSDTEITTSVSVTEQESLHSRNPQLDSVQSTFKSPAKEPSVASVWLERSVAKPCKRHAYSTHVYQVFALVETVNPEKNTSTKIGTKGRLSRETFQCFSRFPGSKHYRLSEVFTNHHLLENSEVRNVPQSRFLMTQETKVDLVDAFLNEISPPKPRTDESLASENAPQQRDLYLDQYPSKEPYSPYSIRTKPVQPNNLGKKTAMRAIKGEDSWIL